MEKNCLNCGHRLVGRSDKKFCDNGCRYTHHNRINSQRVNEGRRILYAARKNVRILERLTEAGKSCITRRELLENGFNFQAVTGLIPADAACTTLRVFELELTETSNGAFRIKKVA